MTPIYRKALVRLFTETTFPLLLVGLVALVSATQPSDASLWRDVLKVMGALIVAMVAWRPLTSMDLRGQDERSASAETPSR